MKVAVFVDKPLPEERPTGIGVAAYEMSLALSKRGLKVHYVCRGRADESFASSESMMIHQVRNYSRDNVREALKIVKQGKPNVVHVHSSSALPALILGRAFCPVVIMHSHGDEPLRPLRPALMRKVGMNFSHKVVAISEDTKRGLVRQGIPSKKIAVVYNGVDVEEFEPRPATSVILEKYGLADSGDIVLSIGTVQKRKGQWRMLRCMPELLKERPDLVYVNIGSAYDSSYLNGLKDEAARLGVSDNVRFLSGVPQKDLPSLVNSAKLCVHLATREGFGLAVVEEMASGKPVVAFNVAALPEIIEDGVDGVLVAPQDSQALTKWIGTLLNSHVLAQRIGDAARAKVVSKFTWDQTARQLERVYKGLLT